jgi:hypothetical protein
MLLVPTLALGAASPPCRVSSPRLRLRNAMVQPDGGASSFTVSMASAHVTARPGVLFSTVDVEGTLAFSARMVNRELPYRIRAGARSLNGQVRLGDVAWRASYMQASATTFIAGVGRVVTPLEWACDALELDGNTQSGASARRDDFPAHVGKIFRLRRDPARRDGIGIDAETELRARAISRRGRWSEVEVALDDYGAIAHGWIPSRYLKAGPPETTGLGDLGTIGAGGGGGCGRQRISGDYGDAALMKPGAVLYAGRGVGAWGRAYADESWEVTASPDDAWVRIDEIPDVHVARLSGCSSGGVWVRRADVTLGVSRRNGLALQRPPVPSLIRGQDEDTPSLPMVVTEVTPGSHFAALGLVVGDRLLRLGSTTILALHTLSAVRSSLGCGGPLTLERDGKTIELRMPDSCPSLRRFYGNGAFDVHH